MKFVFDEIMKFRTIDVFFIINEILNKKIINTLEQSNFSFVRENFSRQLTFCEWQYEYLSLIWQNYRCFGIILLFKIIWINLVHQLLNINDIL